MAYAHTQPKYASPGDFMKVLQERARLYFKDNSLPKTGTTRLYIKAAHFLALHILFYCIAITPSLGIVSNLGAWFLMGMYTIPGIGFNIMHDAGHGSFSSRAWVNNLFASSGSFIGVFVPWWRIQHNILHHTHTNVEGFDNDMDLRPLMCTSHRDKRYWFHRYQHFYCWLLYSFQTLYWIWYTDFARMFQQQIGVWKVEFSWKLLAEFLITKVWHFTMYVWLPYMICGWWGIVGYVIAMLASGEILACVFQCAHLEEETPVVSKVEIQGDWFIHEMNTTVDFAPKNKPLSFFVGGLNYQVEHHLFRNVSHAHYRALAQIVKKTATEYNISYHVHATFREALKSHYEQIKKMGRNN
jgi:linoleoyl-CoA desaturase